jgi:hypothetical protein
VDFIHQDFILNYNPETLHISYPLSVNDLKSITKFLLYKFQRIFISPCYSFIRAIKYPYLFLAHVKKHFKDVFARGSPALITI